MDLRWRTSDLIRNPSALYALRKAPYRQEGETASRPQDLCSIAKDGAISRVNRRSWRSRRTRICSGFWCEFDRLGNRTRARIVCGAESADAAKMGEIRKLSCR